MQLDAEENEDVFYKPPIEPAARAPERTSDDTLAVAQITAEDDDD